MLPRQNLGRRHQRRLPAGLDHVRGSEQRHHGLARADIALEQPEHTGGLREIGDDVGDGLLLRGGERVGQGSNDPRAQAAFGGGAAAGAGALMRAQKRERELAGQQFVVGEPRPGRALRFDVVRRLRTMQAAQRLAESRKTVALEPVRILPLGQVLRHPLERKLDRPAHLVRVQPFGERINRIEQR